MYDMDGILVANPTKRYGIGNMKTDLDVNEDGSISKRPAGHSPERLYGSRNIGISQLR
ncbi:MAG: hypothetical protein GY742_02175 [Hyphomicrobiales bacterium]|nr:hypothetical protein [Hyphomicrobiales bacterium]